MFLNMWVRIFSVSFKVVTYCTTQKVRRLTKVSLSMVVK